MLLCLLLLVFVFMLLVFLFPLLQNYPSYADVVYFLSNTFEGVNVSGRAKAGDVVYNISTVVFVDAENFINPVLTYRSYYSSTFLVR